MNRRFFFSAVVLIAALSTGNAQPIDFGEISLWIRAHQSSQSIIREINQRKLAHALSSQQESTLKAQGASESLLQTLRNPNVISAQSDAAPGETKPQPARTRTSRESDNALASDSVQVFDVSFGHPINLSQWGGPDYEFAFNVYRYAGENIVEPVLIDTVRSYTDIATYNGVLPIDQRAAPHRFHGGHFTPYLGGDLKDDSYMIGNYVTAVTHNASRGMQIDRRHPVWIKGVPYTLYPVYGAGGVSLYYITSSTESVKLAVAPTRF